MAAQEFSGRPPGRGAARPAEHRERRRLGDVLVESGLITADQLRQALDAQRGGDGPRRRIGQMVVDLGFATEREVAECLASLLGLELLDLSRMTPAPDVVRLLPRAVAERTRVLVLDRSDRGILTVAAADPTNVLAFDDVLIYTRSTEIEVFVATDSQIREQINRAWALSQNSESIDDIATVGGDEDDEPDAGAGVADDAPIVRFVNQVLGDAVRMRASDIHLEVERDQLKVRYRVDGLLRDITRAPRRLATSVISRIKIISGLDIAERRVPQDGRTRFTVEGQAIDARISTLPSLHGEKVVIRLLTRGDAVPDLDSLGMEADQLAEFQAALAVPQGLILITGPTGSGKTNTLYSAISQINSPDKNIVTLEDPIEVQLGGITQVQVNEKTGMTFSRGLRSVLRQDPDIILVGEVRDAETAELALKAAMTGHLVLTTLHTNSAVAALTRLVDMGAEPFLVASSLTASIAQRLVRRLCAACSEPYRPDDVTLALLGLVPEDLVGATPRLGMGCHDCGGTGYRGRTAVYEVLTVDAAVRQILLKEPSESALLSQARANGMTTLRTSALIKALRGETTFEEVLRVTHSDSARGQGCPVCQRPVEPDMLVCPWCTAHLARGQCISCGHNLDPEWRVCPWCRTPPAHHAVPLPPVAGGIAGVAGAGGIAGVAGAGGAQAAPGLPGQGGALPPGYPAAYPPAGVQPGLRPGLVPAARQVPGETPGQAVLRGPAHRP